MGGRFVGGGVCGGWGMGGGFFMGGWVYVVGLGWLGLCGGFLVVCWVCGCGFIVWLVGLWPWVVVTGFTGDGCAWWR